MPIASSTCDGSGTPAWHADPVDTAKPATSSRNSSESPSQPANVKWALPGSRPAASGSPRSTASGTDSQDARDQPVPQARQPLGVRGERVVASSAARPNATAPAASCVPERTRCCAAPCSSGSSVGGPRDDERSDPDRTADLVRRDADRLRADGVHVDRHRAVRGDRVQVHGHALRVGEFHDPRHRLQRADLVVGPERRHERDLVAIALQRRLQLVQTDAAHLVEVDPVQDGALARSRATRRCRGWRGARPAAPRCARRRGPAAQNSPLMPEVDRFRAAAGELHLDGVGADRARDLLATGLQEVAGGLALPCGSTTDSRPSSAPPGSADAPDRASAPSPRDRGRSCPAPPVYMSDTSAS